MSSLTAGEQWKSCSSRSASDVPRLLLANSVVHRGLDCVIRRTTLVLGAGALAAAISSGAELVSVPDLAEHGEWDRLHSEIAEGADLNQTQADGMTALHWAVRRGDPKAVRNLLEAGADPLTASRYGVTPLSLACMEGHATLVRLVLEAGADPNAELRGGETPLMTASRAGSHEAVRQLLSHGADVNARERVRGQSALMWAAAEGHAETIRMLVEFGADIQVRLATGFTALLFASRDGRIEAVQALLDAGADPNDWIRPPEGELSQPRRYRGAPPYGASALLLAVENAHYDLAATLLEAGADPNEDRTGYTVLHALARVRKPGHGDNDPAPAGSGEMSSLEFVETLLDHGADLNARMPKHVNLGNTRLKKLGATPFFLAAQSADAALIRKLAELGADTKITNAEGSTPLMAAAGLGTRSPGEDAGTQPEVLEALSTLLELGADINAVDQNGETVMHGAAYKNLPGVVEYLAEQGADIAVWNKMNTFGWTPLTIAHGYRFGNFKPSTVTIEAVERVMLANGVVPPAEVKAVTQQIY